MVGLGAVWTALTGRIEWAAWLVVWAVLLDGLDGLLARLLRARSHFGIEFDSLADNVSFGLAPATLLACYAQELGVGVFDGNPLGWLVLTPSTFYVVMAAVRLARFNVQTIELGEMLFRGIPTPLCAGLVATIVLTLIKHGDPVSARDHVIFLTGVLAVGFGLLMVSNLPLPKFRRRKMKWFSYFQYIMTGVLIVLAFMRRMPEVLAASAAVYTVGGVIVGTRYERSFRLAQERRLGLAQEAELALERLSETDEDDEEAEAEEGLV